MSTFDAPTAQDPALAAQLAQLAQVYGIDPGASAEQAPPETFAPSGYEQWLERFSGGLGGVQAPRPRNFWEGLAVGGVQGLAGQGAKVATARERFTQRQQARQQATDAARAQATHDYRRAAAGLIEETAKAGTKATADAAELDRTSPMVNAQLKSDNPEVARFKEGERVPAAVWTEIQKRRLPQSAADMRASDAADRAAKAAERQARLAEVNSASKLVDDYRLDPDIKAFTATRRNANTIKQAAQLKTGPGDLAVVFAYMRALEPENPNAVREGEYATAAQAMGRAQQLANMPRQWIEGDKLSDAGRRGFIEAANKLLKARQSDYDVANDQYRGRARLYGVDPAILIREYKNGDPQDVAGGPQTAPVPGGFFDSNRPGGR